MVSEVPEIGKNWWLFVVLGVICVVTGDRWPSCGPGITLLTLGIFAGIYLMITAIMEIIDAIIGDPGGRALSAILGIISLIAGLIFLRRPGESLLAIVIVAGIFLVAEGVIRIVRAFGSTGRRWWGVVAGADRRDRRHRHPLLAGHRPRDARGVLRRHDARARRASRSSSASSCAARCTIRTRRRSRPRRRRESAPTRSR